MGSVHALSTGKIIENDEALAEQQAFQRMEGFVKGEMNRLNPRGVEKSWFFYLQEIEQHAYPIEPDTEERKGAVERVRAFLEQEERITGKSIDRKLYSQYWRYWKIVYSSDAPYPSFEEWKTEDDRISTKREEESTPAITFEEWEKRTAIQDWRKTIHAILNTSEPEIPEQPAAQHPATRTLQDLQESQPEPQRLRFRERLIRWLKSWS